MKFKIALIILILSVLGQLRGQEIGPGEGVSGIWDGPDAEILDFRWKAKWIWINETNTDMVLARRVFNISGTNGATLRITASTKYELYVNGSYVIRGPARSAAHHQSFDILNIERLLKPGQNVIAVRVHHQKARTSYNFRSRAGLIAQLDIDGEKSLVTDELWKVSVDPSWNTEAPRISRFHWEVTDLVDLRFKEDGWPLEAFDDSHWPYATVLNRDQGWPGPQKDASPNHLINPWTELVPRDIPYLQEEFIRVEKLIESRLLTKDSIFNSLKLTGDVDPLIAKQFAAFSKKNKPVVLRGEEGRKVLIFDFGEVHNAFPYFDIQGESGLEVQVLAAPYLVDNTFDYQQFESKLIDKITLSGGRDQWRSMYFKPTRFLCLTFESTANLTIYDFGVLSTSYPFERIGNIDTDNEIIARFMDATAQTIDVCTLDGYTDNYRERRQYAQTGYYAALGNYWLFGDYALQRRYLIQVAQEQFANGIMPAYAPLFTDDFMVILDSNLLWIRSLRNYLLYSGDYETVRELLPAANKLMELFHSFTNDLGLIDRPPYAYWLDHAKIDRRGANLTLNAHYVGALKDYIQILEWVGEYPRNVYQNRLDNIRQAVNLFWDSESGLFADALINGQQSESFSEHANGLVLAVGLANPDQKEAVINNVLRDDKHDFSLRDSGLIMVTPAMSYFFHKGLCEAGMLNESLEMMSDRFSKMLDEQHNGTLWEEWVLNGTGRSGKIVFGRTRSDAQTESAFMPDLYAEYVVGVKVLAPGMKEMEIGWCQPNYQNIEALFPTPYGNLSIDWSVDEMLKTGILNMEIPDGMSLHLKDETLKLFNNSIEVLNKDSGQMIDNFILKAGNYQITF